MIKTQNQYISLLTNLLNKLIEELVNPEEISLARLVYLNKNATEPGNVNGIRPLTIVGIALKIIECPLLEELKKVKLNPMQLGIREGLGTELNILRL